MPIVAVYMMDFKFLENIDSLNSYSNLLWWFYYSEEFYLLEASDIDFLTSFNSSYTN